MAVKLRRAVHNSNLRCPGATWMYIYEQAILKKDCKDEVLGSLTHGFDSLEMMMWTGVSLFDLCRAMSPRQYG